MTLDVLQAGLAVVDAAAWLGAMLYSLLVVQPRATEYFGALHRYESFAVVLGAGVRWKVIAMAAALAVSGAGLVAIQIARADDPSTLWIALVVAKAVLLLLAVALFAHVSWRLWPARIFAATAELPAIQMRFPRGRPDAHRPRRRRVRIGSDRGFAAHLNQRAWAGRPVVSAPMTARGRPRRTRPVRRPRACIPGARSAARGAPRRRRRARLRARRSNTGGRVARNKGHGAYGRPVTCS